MSKSPDGDSAPRNAFQLLMSRSFGSFFFARLLMATGVWLHAIVASIAVFDLTESALVVGIVSFVQFAPQIAMGPFTGVWADRGNIKRQMIIGRVLCAVGSTGLAFWLLLPTNQSDRIDVGIILFASLAVGVGNALGGPAMHAAPATLVQRNELPAAMALNTAPLTLGRIVGPALGALASVGFGFGWAFLTAGLSHLLFILLISWITFPPPQGHRSDQPSPMSKAFAFIKSDRQTLLVLVGITVLGLASEPAITLAPPLAATLDGGTMTVGALTSSMGVGAAAGVIATSLFARRIRQDVTAPTGLILMAIAWAICSAPVPEEVAIGSFGLSGFGFILSVSSFSTIMQMHIPPLLRGRIMALWLMGFVGSRPLGALVVGTVSDFISLYAAFGLVAAVLLVVALICRPSQLRES